MNINIYFVETDTIYIDRNRIKEIILSIVTFEGFFIGDINVILTSDIYLIKINRDFLGHDYYTDTISFPDNRRKQVNGDIFISMDAVKRNAKKFSNGDNMLELYRIIIHGVLHLCGYSDHADDTRYLMTNKENFYLNKLYLLL